MLKKQSILYGVITIIGLMIILITVKCVCTKNIKEKMTEESLIFFYADWCGYCKSFKPEVEKYKGIHVEKVDCTNPTENEKKLMQEYNVNGFPALFYKSDSNVVTFEKSRTIESITSFVDECRVKHAK